MYLINSSKVPVYITQLDITVPARGQVDIPDTVVIPNGIAGISTSAAAAEDLTIKEYPVSLYNGKVIVYNDFSVPSGTPVLVTDSKNGCTVIKADGSIQKSLQDNNMGFSAGFVEVNLKKAVVDKIPDSGASSEVESATINSDGTIDIKWKEGMAGETVLVISYNSTGSWGYNTYTIEDDLETTVLDLQGAGAGSECQLYNNFLTGRSVQDFPVAISPRYTIS